MAISDSIRNIRNKLLEATSSYDDRVNRVADDISKKDISSSDELDSMIEYVSEKLEITEYRIKHRGSKAWKEFVKDVKARLKSLGWKIKKASSIREPKEKIDYDKLVQEILFEIGDVFPDGDPHDACLNWCRKKQYSVEKFFHDLWPKAKKAFKKATGFEDLYDYYEDLIKQHEADNEGPVYSDV